MPAVNGASPRARLDDCRARSDGIRRKGGAGADTIAPVGAPFLPPGILVAVFPGKATPRTPRNSGIPPSQARDGDGTARRDGKGARGEGPKARETEPGNRRTVTVTESSPVAECRKCGQDPCGGLGGGHDDRKGAQRGSGDAGGPDVEAGADTEGSPQDGGGGGGCDPDDADALSGTHHHGGQRQGVCRS